MIDSDRDTNNRPAASIVGGDPAAGGVALAGNLLIRDVDAARLRFLESLDAGGPVTVDVTGLEAVDTAGVQLLLALRLEAVRHGRAFHILGASASLNRAVKRLGLREALFGAESHGS